MNRKAVGERGDEGSDPGLFSLGITVKSGELGSYPPGKWGD